MPIWHVSEGEIWNDFSGSSTWPMHCSSHWCAVYSILSYFTFLWWELIEYVKAGHFHVTPKSLLIPKAIQSSVPSLSKNTPIYYSPNHIISCWSPLQKCNQCWHSFSGRLDCFLQTMMSGCNNICNQLKGKPWNNCENSSQVIVVS